MWARAPKATRTSSPDTSLAARLWKKAPANGVTVIRSFKSDEKVVAVKLLGSGPVAFSQNYGALTVKLPEKLPTAYTNCLAVELAK
jgi:alpha-L-fucosidase